MFIHYIIETRLFIEIIQEKLITYERHNKLYLLCRYFIDGNYFSDVIQFVSFEQNK